MINVKAQNSDILPLDDINIHSNFKIVFLRKRTSNKQQDAIINIV